MSCNPSIQAQPNVTEWKFLMARLSSDMGDTENARKVFEEILESNPLWFEALFENALLMDWCGEGEKVITRLEEALRIAEAEGESKAK
jgi:tetratricopeptide (TPR) repeat protein